MKRKHICFCMQQLACMSDLNVLIVDDTRRVVASEFYLENRSELFVLCIECSDCYCHLCTVPAMMGKAGIVLCRFCMSLCNN